MVASQAAMPLWKHASKPGEQTCLLEALYPEFSQLQLLKLLVDVMVNFWRPWSWVSLNILEPKNHHGKLAPKFKPLVWEDDPERTTLLMKHRYHVRLTNPSWPLPMFGICWSPRTVHCWTRKGAVFSTQEFVPQCSPMFPNVLNFVSDGPLLRRWVTLFLGDSRPVCPVRWPQCQWLVYPARIDGMNTSLLVKISVFLLWPSFILFSVVCRWSTQPFGGPCVFNWSFLATAVAKLGHWLVSTWFNHQWLSHHQLRPRLVNQPSSLPVYMWTYMPKLMVNDCESILAVNGCRFLDVFYNLLWCFHGCRFLDDPRNLPKPDHAESLSRTIKHVP